MTNNVEARRRFFHVGAAGITFQGGSAAVDSSTIMATLAYQLTGSAMAVGAVTTILRVGWLAPQLFVAYLSQRRGASLPYFMIGAFGRATCLALLACLLAFASHLPLSALIVGFFLTWTGYAFVSGLVAVPYNDIVARSVTSERRSRLLAIRFLGGGLLGLAVAVAAERLVAHLAFPASYAAIVALAATLMYISSVLFVWPGEPSESSAPKPTTGFLAYLREGADVFRRDRLFRRFAFSQWSGALALMALPFYVVAAADVGFDVARVALLLAAQTAGGLVSNPLWGWWGDHHGKRSLLEGIALLRVLPPVGVICLMALSPASQAELLVIFGVLFFVLGAITNGLTIAVLGFLMEISPDDQRRAYSGYFNALTAPAYLLPLVGGLLAELAGLTIVFVAAAVGAAAQWKFVRGGLSSSQVMPRA